MISGKNTENSMHVILVFSEISKSDFIRRSADGYSLSTLYL